MTKRDEIKAAISRNLEAKHLGLADLRVQPDPFGGWRIVVISEGFEGKTRETRASLSLHGIDPSIIQWAELLTPSEAEWAGTTLADSELSDLPLWKNALARASILSQDEEGRSDLLFPSELDVDLPAPISVTFYSVRGGVGRSTALGYTARILASRGYKVICVDLDLEAPGLASLFGVEEQVVDGQGVVPLLVAIDKGDDPDFSKHLIRISEADELYCLPAGRADALYAHLLALIDPPSWYSEDKNPLRELVEGLKTRLPFTPDVLLFDSRTGISEISAPLLFDLADMSIIVFFPHPQTERATGEVVRALLSSQTGRHFDRRRLTPEPRFVVSPIPSSRVPEIVQRYRRRSEDWIARWLGSIGSALADSPSEITHYIPYREEIATADVVSAAPEAWRDYAAVADWIERFLPSAADSDKPAIQVSKDRILSELHFSTGTAEYQEAFLETFLEAGVVIRALDISTPLVLGRKGVGKTAVFRRLLERQQPAAIPVTAPAPLRAQRPWILSADAFAEIDILIQEKGTTWRQFWLLLNCIACHYAWFDDANRPAPPTPVIGALPDRLGGPTETVQLIENLLSISRIGLIADDWFRVFDAAAGRTVLLLFDALDTGFGNGEEERERRRRAIEGLCGLLIQQSETAHIKYKVVLREDIWRTLRFENKSHLFGRYVTLDWRDQQAYYKVALKQALRSPVFADLLRPSVSDTHIRSVDHWSEPEVILAWNFLVGERMKGEKTAFTRNWVWSRLADANGDHTPRYLLQLFREVVSKEMQEQQRSPYDRSILRPRAFIQALPEVSAQALDALREEYPELEALMDRLKQIGRTPIASDELSDLTDSLALAREVGLIGIYEGTEDRVERYRVPDIYRYALNMTRKGQA